jgi:hypothetical protein
MFGQIREAFILRWRCVLGKECNGIRERESGNLNSCRTEQKGMVLTLASTIMREHGHIGLIQ